MKLICKKCDNEDLKKSQNFVICEKCHSKYALEEVQILLKDIGQDFSPKDVNTLIYRLSNSNLCEYCGRIKEDIYQPLCNKCASTNINPQNIRRCVSCKKIIPKYRNHIYCDDCNFKIFHN